MKQSTRYQGWANDIEAFLARWTAFRQDPGDPDLREAVARSAGPAGAAADRAGIKFEAGPPPMFGVPKQRVCPIRMWANSSAMSSVISPSDVTDYALQTASTLATMARAARADERSLAGRSARFLGFPTAVRARISSDHGDERLASSGYFTMIAVQAVGSVAAAVFLGYVGWSAVGG